MSKATILVAEDDWDLREALCDTLEIAGFRIVSACSAEEALEVLATRDVDMLVSDERLGSRLLEETDMLALRGELTAVGRGTVGLGKRVQQLQQRLQTVEHRQEVMEYKDVGNIAITHANKLVQMGVATDDLISTCGLSQAEASLVSLMHGNAKKTATKNTPAKSRHSARSAA